MVRFSARIKTFTLLVCILQGLTTSWSMAAAANLEHSRSLSATSCDPLQVGGKSYTFDNCEDLSGRAGVPFTLYYTLEPSSSGGTSFKGGLKIASSGGYGSIAFGPRMIGADAVIVYPDSSSSTGASVNGYKLTSYQASAINAAKGSYPLTDTSAAKNADGSLVAVFTAPLDGTPDSLAGQVSSLLYVVNGQMNGNQLGTHIALGSKYGSTRHTFAAPAATTVPAATPTPIPTPTPTPTPETTAPVVVSDPIPAETTTPLPAQEGPAGLPFPIGGHGDGEHDGDHEGHGLPGGLPDPDHEGHGGHGGLPGGFPGPDGLDYGLTDTNPTNTTNAPGATAAAGATVAGASKCTADVGGNSVDYNACYSVTSIAPDFMVYYTFTEDPADPTSSILSMAFSGSTEGYLSVGFPSTPAKMVGSNAMTLATCPSCSTGAKMTQYYLAGEQESDMQVTNNMAVTDVTAYGSNGKLSGSFKVALPGVSAKTTSRRRLNAFQASIFPLIYASGPVSNADGSMLMHEVEGDGDVDLTAGEPGSSGGVMTDAITVEGGSQEKYKQAHMWLMVIGWGVIIPVGIFTARYFQNMGCWWFHVHRAFQCLGFIMVVVGLALGFVANDGWDTDLPVHRDLGMAATVLALVQVTALVARPSKEHRHRSVWFHFHAWIGRSAAILAIANIYYGIIMVEELGTWAWAAYTGVLGAIVLASVFMEAQRCMGGRTVASGRSSPADMTPNGSTANLNGKQFISSTTTSASHLEARAVP